MNRRARVWLLGLLGALLPASPAGAAPRITEFLAENDGSLADEDGEFSDWIEIHNPDPSAVDLGGWHLTDNPLDLDQWTIPAGVTLPAGGYLVVFASGKNRAAAGSELHTNFKLSAGGEYVGLVAPDGTTVIDGHSFPEQFGDVGYGAAGQPVRVDLINSARPAILVPQSEGGLPAAWHSPGYVPDGSWLAGTAPAAVGYDTAEAPVPLTNTALTGTASQSTTLGAAYPAANGNDGNTGNFTHTLIEDTNPWWQLSFPADREIHEVVLHNRDDCCAERLRDITVEILDGSGSVVLYTSPLLNPGNSLNKPAEIFLDVAADHGSPVTGRTLRVRRTRDPGGTDEANRNVLSLGEVLVMVPDPDADPDDPHQERNLALHGSAYQTTTLGGFYASLAIDSNTGNFTHTVNSDAHPAWWVDLENRSVINEITLHNRDNCCPQRLRDITVEVLGEDGVTPVFSSGLLNPENADGSPELIDLDLVGLTGGPVIGRKVRVSRTPDPDNSGQGGAGSADDAAALSLGEVLVTGLPGFGFDAFIRDDIETVALGHNASAFLRIPFEIDDAAALVSLALRMRYDAGFVAYLNGTEVARRNAPASPAWNSSATTERDNADALQWEEINLDAQLGLLESGTNVLAIQMLNITAGDSDFFLSPQLAGGQTYSGGDVYLTLPTPGAPNNSAWYVTKVADTKFSVDRGFHETPFSVTISTATPGAAIRYTTDGSAPGENRGTIYTGPVQITRTTVLRALAYKQTFRSTNVDTRTYIFLDDVIASEQMLASVTQDPVYGPQMRDALTDLPTISLAFSGDIDRSEKAASVELIGFADGDLQENCGMARFGSYVTNFAKRNIRLYFRDQYGAKKLQYPLFNGHERDMQPVAEFDQLDLRTGSHDMSERGFYMSNSYMDDTLLDMGHLNPHGRYVHVYVNGAYWGMYHLRERWNAEMHAAYLGGRQEDYEAVSSNLGGGDFTPAIPYDGDGSAWANVVALKGDYENLRAYLDVPEFIDYMLLFMSGNSEAEHRAVGPLGAGSGFLLYHNDADGFTRTPPNRTGHVGPDGLLAALRAQNHPDFRVLVADRIQKHYFNGGAMTSARAVARLTGRTTQVGRAFLAESARWNYRTPASWQSAKDSYINNVLTTIDQAMTAQFRGAGLLPATAAPVFSQHGGEVPSGYQLLITTSTAGTAYYTLDGSDPRLPGGTLAAAAIPIGAPPAGAPLITGNTFVRARTRNGTEWSGLTEAFFTVPGQPALPPADLALAEIHYNPASTSEGTEFIELLNMGARPVNLRGSLFNAGVQFRFPQQWDTILPPGQRVVLAGSLHAMLAAHGLAVPVAGLYQGNLDNPGEFLRYQNAGGTVLAEFTFDDQSPWPEAPDGSGPSLVMINPASSADPNDPFSWRSGTVHGGSPGWDDSVLFTGDPNADDNHDGLSNLLDHALGNTPGRPPSRLAMSLDLVDTGSGPEPRLTITHRANLADPSLGFIIEISDNLADWQSGPDVTGLVGRLDHGDGTATLTWRSTQPLEPGDLRRFVRLRVDNR